MKKIEHHCDPRKGTVSFLFLLMFLFLPASAATARVFTPPVLLSPANGSTMNNPSPFFVGNAQPGNEIRVYVDNILVATTTADANGNWAAAPSSSFFDGAHTVYAAAYEGGIFAGNSNTNTFTIDTTPPPAPVVATPANGSTTSDATPVYSGTAEPLSTVTVIVDAAPAGTTTADSSGNWTWTPTVALAGGAHTVRARATDQVGNPSPSSAPNNFTITLPPTAAEVSVSGRVVTASGRGIARAMISLIEPDGTVRIVLTNQSGFYRFDRIAVGGTVTLTVAAKNRAFSDAVRVFAPFEAAENVNFTSDN